MIDLERTVAQRFPHWFAGHRARVSRPLLAALARFSHLPRINEFLERNAHLRGLAFVEAALELLDARYLIDHVERERIPESGRCVIVANHPLGAIDALALLKCVGDVRRDVKILANDLLLSIKGIEDLLLPLRILGGKPNSESVQAAHVALANECALIVFPAGEVARLGWRGIQDSPWRRGFLRFAEEAQAPIVPVHLSGRNSHLFYGLAAVARPLGTALLPREMFAKRGRRIEIRVGTPVAPAQLQAIAATPQARIQAIREALPDLARNIDRLPARPTSITHAPRLRDQLADLRALDELGVTADGKRVLAGRLDSDRPLMREIARLRELSFRAVGEGSGKRADLDRFDAHYDQLLLWDDTCHEIAGAYRVGRCAPILSTHGIDGLYSASLFQFAPDLVAQLDGAMELGRSFVQPKYWGSRSLDYLWVGIGAYLRAHPEVRKLFGPVSISAELSLPARQLLVAYYQRFHGTQARLATSARPFAAEASAALFADLDAETAMRVLRENLDALGARVPTLYKQYTELCEPGGARFLAFGTDPDFANAVDGLILVDLDRVTPRKRARYLDPPRARGQLLAGVAA
jgi:putative hemolysin